MAADQLDFFNSLTGRLEIELSEPTVSPPDLAVAELALPGARVIRLHLKAEVFERSSETFRDLTQSELAGTAFAGRWIVLKGEAEIPVRHEAPNGTFFTVADLLAAVEETERQTRASSDWFDGVDVHHVFFEGIRQTRRFPNREWSIDWGS